MNFSILDIFFILLILGLGHYRINWLSKKLGVKFAPHAQNLTYLFYYKIVFGIIYALYVFFLGGDALGYWKFGLQQVQVVDPTWLKYYGVSTTFVLFVIYPFSKILGLSFLSGSVMFAFLAFLGFTYLYIMLLPYAKYIKIKGIQLFPAIFFLPNLNFWSSGVGKDALIFMAIAMFIYCTRNVYKNILLIGISFFIAYHLRPHIGILMGASLFAAFLTGGGLTINQKIVGSILGIGALIVIWPTASEFLKLDSFSVESFQNVANAQIANLNRSSVGSAVDLASYSLPLRIFTYLYRPLFFDAHNAFALIVSFENFLYLLLSLSLFNVNVIKTYRKAPIYFKTGIIAFVGSALAFSNSLSNLGIAMRMKNMTMIYLIMFICFMVAYDNYLKVKK